MYMAEYLFKENTCAAIVVQLRCSPLTDTVLSERVHQQAHSLSLGGRLFG